MQRKGPPERAHSIFVCHHPAELDKARPAIGPALAALGPSALLFPGFWFLRTALGASEVKAELSHALGQEESLAVIDATNHEAAWRNIRPEAAELIRQNWHDSAVPSFQASAARRPPLGEQSGSS